MNAVLQHLNGVFDLVIIFLPVLDRVLDQPQDLEQPMLQIGDQLVAAVRAGGRKDSDASMTRE